MWGKQQMNYIFLWTYQQGKPGCPHITNQFNFCCKGKSYSIQIFEILSGNGHDEYDIADENISRLKEGREDFEENIKD